MLPDKEMEELFNSQLAGYESPVPEGMWERIIRKKDEDRKGFVFFFRMFGFFILGVGIAGILLFKWNGLTKIPAVSQDLNSKQTRTADPGSIRSSKNTETATISRSQNNSNVRSTKRLQEKPFHSLQHADKQARKKNSHVNFISADHQELTNGNPVIDTANKKEVEKGSATIISADSSGSGKPPVPASVVSGSKPPLPDSVRKEPGKKSDSTKQKFKAVWSVDAYGSPDYPFVFGGNYEQMRLSYTIGFRLNRSFGKRFSGSVGIQYSVINFYGSDSLGGPGLNHLKRLDIPVLVGYQLDTKNINTVIHAGLIFNLNTKYQSALTYYPDYFKTNTGLGAYLGVNLEKHINYHFSVFGEPYLRFQITQMTDGGANNYINVTGLSLGLRYYFKK